MPIPEEVIQRRWITVGNSELWDTKGTYTSVEYPRLPALPPIHFPFDWLSAFPKRNYGCTLHSDENRLTGLMGIQAKVQSLGFQLPEDFETLILRPDIQAQIPSCTACYLELSDVVMAFPGFPGSCAVRFMNDSQGCVFWYLLFQHNTPTRVLASDCYLERDLFDMMAYRDEADEPLRHEDVLKNSCICGESFGEFIFRFCIENAIWYAAHDKCSLSPCESDYLHQAKKKA